MTTITPRELMKRLGEVRGSKIITVVMVTHVKLLKKNRDTKDPCPYVGVKKKTRCTVLIGTDYERGVNTRREKEGTEQDFITQEHAWATHTDDPVISKKGDQFYANFRLQKTLETTYTCNGKVIDRELLRPFQTPKKKPLNQGVENPVEWRNPKIYPECSIESYKSDGEEIEVTS